MKLTNVTLKLAPDELKFLRAHGYWAKYIVEEECAHANVVPCTKTHRCGWVNNTMSARCYVFEADHDADTGHKFEDRGCGSYTCTDCEENLG